MALGAEKRRQRVDAILDAAEALIRESGIEALSMRALAEEAGVSPATPFNLLGSRHAILVALLERSVTTLDLSDLPRQPIEAIFVACERLTERYTRDGDYIRALLIEIGPAPPSILQMAIRSWTLALETAAAAGAIERRADLALLAEQLEVTFSGTLVLWVWGSLQPDRLTAQYRYGVACALLSVATPESQKRVRKHLRQAGRDLSEFDSIVDACAAP